MKHRKYLVVFIIAILIVSLFFPISVQAKQHTAGEVIDEAKNFIDTGTNGTQKINTSSLNDTSSLIYNILFTIAVIVAVAVAGVLGIQFMMASAEDKAKVKEALIPFVVGCIIVFGGFGIWKVVISVMGAL